MFTGIADELGVYGPHAAVLVLRKHLVPAK